MLSISELQQLLHTGHQNDYFDALYTYILRSSHALL